MAWNRKMKKLGAKAEVYKGDIDPSDWVVWALDPDDDGGMLVAIFSGPDAENRALEYAEAKFASVLLHKPDQQPYRCGQSPSGYAGRFPSRGANLRLVK